MHATEPIRRPDALDLSSDVPQTAHSAPSVHPTAAEVLDEIVPMIGVVAGYGPPIVFLVGPWLLFAVMLAGPFAVLLTFVVLLAAAAALIAIVGAIIASPYLLVRHLREHRERPAVERVGAPQLLPVRSPRADA